MVLSSKQNKNSPLVINPINAFSMFAFLSSLFISLSKSFYSIEFSYSFSCYLKLLRSQLDNYISFLQSKTESHPFLCPDAMQFSFTRTNAETAESVLFYYSVSSSFLNGNIFDCNLNLFGRYLFGSSKQKIN